MADGVQVTSTGVAVGTTGVIVAANGTACCCSSGTQVCAECGDCCFSDQSTIDVTWSLDAVTSSLGDASVGKRSGSQTGIPFMVPQPNPGLLFYWQTSTYNTDPTQLTVYGGCATGGTVWGFGSNDAGFAVDHYLIEGGYTSPSANGDCCGFDGTTSIRVTHFGADGAVLGQATGTGHVTITVNNNLCCRASLHVCNKVENNCDGTCPSSP